jgi:ABC-type phosphate transport system auxiliary subunit
MIHINRFIDKIAAAESKQQKVIAVPIKDAKGLHSDITKLLLVLQELQGRSNAVQDNGLVEKVEITGGNFT